LAPEVLSPAISLHVRFGTVIQPDSVHTCANAEQNSTQITLVLNAKKPISHEYEFPL
jgi:hypothetical protein